MPRFDRIVVVDWSAASAPSPARPSADAIWMAVWDGPDEAVTYHRTRHAAEAALTATLAAPGRVLVGFDFAMGYPQGFAERLTGSPKAKAVWAWMADHVTDGPDNANTRFALAAAINARLTDGRGPFWGRPAGLDLPALPARRNVDYAAIGLAERRAVERVLPRAQPVWKLYTTGAVGSQTLMGLPMIHRLAGRADVAVWPFAAAADQDRARIVVAEVYPSLLAGPVAALGGIRDAAQVRLLARALGRLGKGVGALLAAPPDPAANEEGWVLGAGHDPMLIAALAGGAP